MSTGSGRETRPRYQAPARVASRRTSPERPAKVRRRARTECLERRRPAPSMAPASTLPRASPRGSRIALALDGAERARLLARLPVADLEEQPHPAEAMLLVLGRDREPQPVGPGTERHAVVHPPHETAGIAHHR